MQLLHRRLHASRTFSLFVPAPGFSINGSSHAQGLISTAGFGTLISFRDGSPGGNVNDCYSHTLPFLFPDPTNNVSFEIRWGPGGYFYIETSYATFGPYPYEGEEL